MEKFLAGLVDKYTWVDMGSSFLPGELQAAVLMAQLDAMEPFTARRLQIWQRYHDAFYELETLGHLTRLHPPEHGTHNGHIFAVVLDKRHDRTEVLKALLARGVLAVFHYIPLHSAPAGLAHGRVAGPMEVTDNAGAQLIRLPLFADLSDSNVERVIETLIEVLFNVPPLN